MTDAIVEPAHAKLNVFLRVLGRREDGYHELQTVILPLELHDVVRVEAAETFSVEVTGDRAGDLAARGGESLVTRAALAFGQAIGLGGPPALRVTVDKRIPVGGGMGGGSADAAALLRVCGGLHRVAVDDLVAIAAGVGSDVPALVLGGPVYAEGRGERVARIHALTTHWIVRPFPFAVSTPDAYGWWDAAPATGPDPGALIAALETGNDELLGSALFDDLQDAAVARHPEIGDSVDAFRREGALGAVMTGSGPTVVALARHLGHADALVATQPDGFATTGPPR